MFRGVSHREKEGDPGTRAYPRQSSYPRCGAVGDNLADFIESLLSATASQAQRPLLRTNLDKPRRGIGYVPCVADRLQDQSVMHLGINSVFAHGFLFCSP